MKLGVKQEQLDFLLGIEFFKAETQMKHFGNLLTTAGLQICLSNGGN